MSRIEQIFQRPSVKHGLLVGAVLLGLKIVFYSTGNWAFRWNENYRPLSFFVLTIGVFLASREFRNVLQDSFKYKLALLVAMEVIAVGCFVSVLADGILYNIIDRNLTAQTVLIRKEILFKTFEQVKSYKIFSNELKDQMLIEVEQTKYGNFFVLLFDWVGNVFSNIIPALILALFTRYKAPRNNWVNQPPAE